MYLKFLILPLFKTTGLNRIYSSNNIASKKTCVCVGGAGGGGRGMPFFGFSFSLASLQQGKSLLNLQLRNLNGIKLLHWSPVRLVMIREEKKSKWSDFKSCILNGGGVKTGLKRWKKILDMTVVCGLEGITVHKLICRVSLVSWISWYPGYHGEEDKLGKKDFKKDPLGGNNEKKEKQSCEIPFYN